MCIFFLLLFFSSCWLDRLCGSVDESEDVVEDVVAAGTVGQELEGLGVAHGSLLLVDLQSERSVVVSDRNS